MPSETNSNTGQLSWLSINRPPGGLWIGAAWLWPLQGHGASPLACSMRIERRRAEPGVCGVPGCKLVASRRDAALPAPNCCDESHYRRPALRVPAPLNSVGARLTAGNTLMLRH